MEANELCKRPEAERIVRFAATDTNMNVKLTSKVITFFLFYFILA